VEAARINLAYHPHIRAHFRRIGRIPGDRRALGTAGQGNCAGPRSSRSTPSTSTSPSSSASLLRLQKSMASGALKKDGTSSAKVKLLLKTEPPTPLEGTMQFRDITVDPHKRILYPAHCFSQSAGNSAAGYVCPGHNRGRCQRTGAPGSPAGRQPRPEGESSGFDRRCGREGSAADVDL
jgi:hypothetical protein